MRLFNKQTITDLAARFIIPSGKYKGLYIVMRGTNQTGQTFTLSQCGQIQISVNGNLKSLFDFDKMFYMNKLDYGTGYSTSTAGSTFIHSIYVPFHLPDDNDVAYTVLQGKKVEVVHNFPEATITSNGIVTYCGIVADDVAVTPYELRWNNHDLTAGASGSFNFKIYQENINKLYIENDSSLISMSVIKDGISVCDNMSREDLYTICQILRRVETFSTTIEYFDFDLTPVKDELASLNDDVNLILTLTAATTIKTLVLCQDQTPNKLTQSVILRDTAIDKKIQRKSTKVSPNLVKNLRLHKSNA